MYGRGKKPSKPKAQNIRNHFILKKGKKRHFLKQNKKKKEKKELEKKNKLITD